MKKVIAKYQLLVYDDLSTEIIPMSDAGESCTEVTKPAEAPLLLDEMLKEKRVIISGRLQQLLSVFELVCADGELADNLQAFKKKVNGAIQKVAKKEGVTSQTVHSKCTVKCSPQLTLNEFVELLHTFLENVQNASCPMRNDPFWSAVLSNCSEKEQDFAADFISALVKKYYYNKNGGNFYA